MKKLYFAALAAIFLLASCTKDGNEGGLQVSTGEKATLSIKLANNATRAEGANAEGYETDKDIKEFVAVIMDVNDTIIGSGVSADGTDINGMETTTAAVKLLVISNFNTALTTGTTLKTTITDMASLMSAIDVDLANGNNATITKTASSVWSAGEQTITWSGTLDSTGEAYQETVEITIYPVVAKVNLAVTMPTGYGDNTASFMMSATDGILVLNAVSETKFFGSKAFNGTYTGTDYPWLTPASKSYYSGMSISNGADFINENTTEVMDFLKDGFLADAGDTKEYHYYLFENNADKAADHSTIVTLKGTWGVDLEYDNADHFNQSIDEAERIAIAAELKKRDVYFPIHLTSLDAGQYTTDAYGQGVQRGKCYNISITLKPENFAYPNGGGFPYVFPDDFPIEPENLPIVPPVTPPGTEDPTEEYAKALCDVKVSVADWVGINIDREF